MFGDGERHHHLFTHLRFVEIVHRPAHHEPFGQVIEQVAHPHQAELFERLLQLRSHAFKAVRFGKQRIEFVRAHSCHLASWHDIAKWHTQQITNTELICENGIS